MGSTTTSTIDLGSKALWFQFLNLVSIRAHRVLRARLFSAHDLSDKAILGGDLKTRSQSIQFGKQAAFNKFGQYMQYEHVNFLYPV
jgi:hypothetical protein